MDQSPKAPLHLLLPLSALNNMLRSVIFTSRWKLLLKFTMTRHSVEQEFENLLVILNLSHRLLDIFLILLRRLHRSCLTGKWTWRPEEAFSKRTPNINQAIRFLSNRHNPLNFLYHLQSKRLNNRAIIPESDKPVFELDRRPKSLTASGDR